ncbi:hypothetical protein [Candidatus Laterigemmans baculatus]|uniref:hypothetical protein n=1 Tax=Candidatus Laterigemmans baculatus TaxID=2770505 RepID=UPI0013DB5067|nr:hypothetical protein [Candidatus Laterigemmans baculatus]
MVDLKDLMSQEELEQIGVAAMSPDQQQAIWKWGIRMYSLGQHVVSEIAELKYEGRLIILTDGSRWEVDELDASTAEFWSELDRVVVIDGEMYRLEDAERVDVTEE